MSRIALALVGLGKIARDQHLPCLEHSDAFDLVATVSLADRLPDVPGYVDLDAALDAHPEIRAVALCTPPAVRSALAARAVARGRHVLLEKPPCARPRELDDLCRLARHRGASVFAAWHSRYAAAVETVRNRLVGRDVLGVRVTWKEDHRYWHPGQDWLWQDEGFGVLDPGINALSILTHVLPIPLEFVSAELDCPADSAMPVAARAMLASGAAPVEIDLDFLHDGTACWDIAIETATSALTLSDGGARLSIDGDPHLVPAQREYAALYKRFAGLIAAGEHDADGTPLALASAILQHGRRRRLNARVLG